MTTTAEATAAFVRVTLGGTTYRVSPLQDKDFGVFERWVQQRFLDVVKQNLEGLTEDQATRQLDRAFERAGSITFISPEASALMASVEGAVFLFWLSVRHEHPDVTESQLTKLLTDPANMDAVMDIVHDLNKEHTPVKKKRPAPKRKKRPKPKAAKRKRRATS